MSLLRRSNLWKHVRSTDLGDTGKFGSDFSIVKRRFIRQNREIAKVNGDQGIKIRHLEDEHSRLLSENIALRQQVVKLQFQIDSSGGLDNINAVKGKLEAKLGELGGLLEELGDVQHMAESRRALRRRSGAKASPNKLPDQRSLKKSNTTAAGLGDAEGRLPPIVEGKYYPRRTLDVDEMVELAQAAVDPTDSPELGPPPIAHFEAGDPIKYDSNGDETQKKLRPDNPGVLNASLLVNLEPRRKRRESSQVANHTVKEPAALGTGHQGDEVARAEQERPLKSGAKRKFNAREEDDIGLTKGGSENDFQYMRNHVLPPRDDTQGSNPNGTEKHSRQKSSEEVAKIKDRSGERSKADASSALTGRNVLAPKSVNTDPVSSPTKNARLSEGEKPRPFKIDAPSKPRDPSRARNQPPSSRFARPAKVPQGGVQEFKDPVQETQVPARPPPKTPAPLDLDVLSPDESEPATARVEGRDTPPPGELDPETANTNAFGSIGRASRRQRGSVSYVQPNLRDKMRRPTKELVDAVGAEERSQQRRAVKTEQESEDAEPIVTGEAASKMRRVVVKKEPNEDGLDWKTLPVKETENDRDRQRANAPSPLGNKVSTAKTDLPASIVTERRRRPSILERETQADGSKSQASGTGSTIAALSNTKSKSREGDVRPGSSDEDRRPAEPAEEKERSPTANPKESKPLAARPSSRRHSSVSDDRIKEVMARRAERRKDTTSSTKSGTSVARDLKNTRSAGVFPAESGEEALGRGERAANRRRSMML
ncbi:MAG: hypothetical protein Q9174_003901 [Haloplaca sp. 1 TL-2023]